MGNSAGDRINYYRLKLRPLNQTAMITTKNTKTISRITIFVALDKQLTIERHNKIVIYVQCHPSFTVLTFSNYMTLNNNH